MCIATGLSVARLYQEGHTPDYVYSAFTYFMFYYDFYLFSGQPGIGKTSSLTFLALTWAYEGGR